MSLMARFAALLFALGALLAISPGPATAQQTVTVEVGDIWYCDPSYSGGVVCDTTIDVGDTVLWDFDAGKLPHTVTECGASCDSPTAKPLFDSGVLSGGTFEYTFNEAGTLLYYCQVHPFSQRGRIIVQGGPPPPTDTPPTGPTNTPPPGATDTPTGGAGAGTATPGATALPTTGVTPPDGSSGGWWALALLGAAGAALAAMGVAAYRRAR